jgi:hypothetical protein
MFKILAVIGLIQALVSLTFTQNVSILFQLVSLNRILNKIF